MTLKKFIFSAGAEYESVLLLFAVLSFIPFDCSEKLKFILWNLLVLDADETNISMSLQYQVEITPAASTFPHKGVEYTNMFAFISFTCPAKMH